MRFLALFFIGMFSVGFLFPQTSKMTPEFYIGATGGYTGSIVSFLPTVKQNIAYGKNAGLVFRYVAERNIGLQAEFLLSQRGWNEASGLFSRQLTYIDFPFMTHIYIGNKSRFLINLGPKVGYLLSENVTSTLPSDLLKPQHTTSVKTPFDYGFCVGLGYQFTLKRNVFQLESRAYYGLSDIYQSRMEDYYDRSNNISASLNFSWLFRTN